MRSPLSRFWNRRVEVPGLSPPEWRLVWLFAGWRVGLFVVAWFATAWFLPEKLLQLGLPATATTVLRDVWLYWDGHWYEAIASQGYAGAVHETPVIFGFFPLYPILGRLTGWALGGDFGLGLLLVANLCTLACCVALYRLALLDTDSPGAERTVALFLLYPFSFFFGCAYTEPLFLLLILLSFLAARRGRWAWCGALGGLAALTRVTGVVLAAVLLVEFLVQERRLRRDVLYLLLIPAGFSLYCLFLWWNFGDPLLYFHSMGGEEVKRAIGWHLWQPILDQAPVLLGNPISPAFVIRWAEFGTVLAAVLGGLVALGRTRLSYGLLCLLLIIPALASGQMHGLPRYGTVLFPLFLMVAGRGEWKGWQIAWLVVSAMLLSLFAMIFTRTCWVA